jgi:phenylalanyl-tRNA synthetase beta chain
MVLDFLTKYFSKKAHVPQTGHVIAAKVTRIEKHPNADRLRVIALTDGVREIYPVVCGAYNFTEGDIVPLALPEARIARNIHSEQHEPFTLGTAKIRGIESQGMICAAFEIGLSDELSDKPEIMVLPQDTKIGTILQ